MTGAIRRLLEEAADQTAESGAVDITIQSQLAGEGYLLSALDRDVGRILSAREQGEHFAPRT